jgi:general secretion pathway protein J
VSEGSWREEWLDKEVQPRLVKIGIELENEIYWPEMVIDLKITATPNNTDFNLGNMENIDEPQADQ